MSEAIFSPPRPDYHRNVLRHPVRCRTDRGRHVFIERLDARKKQQLWAGIRKAAVDYAELLATDENIKTIKALFDGAELVMAAGEYQQLTKAGK